MSDRRARRKKCIAWVMFVFGVAGSVLSFFKVLAPHEPQFVLQLSWAAIWSTGITSLLVADED